MSGFEEFQRRPSQRRAQAGGYVFGIIIILVGTVMLLNTLGLLNARNLWDYVPLIVVVLGVAKISDGLRPTSVALGAVMVAVGTLWFLDNIELINFNKRILGPCFIIAMGFIFLFRSVERQRAIGTGAAAVDNDDQVSLWTMFGGVKRVVTSQEFRGGDASALFGGIELDLRRARLAGDAVVVDASVMFGGLDVKVPENWTVEIKGVAILGGFEDKTFHPPAGQPGPRLVVTGFALFGGVSVQNG